MSSVLFKYISTKLFLSIEAKLQKRVLSGANAVCFHVCCWGRLQFNCLLFVNPQSTQSLHGDIPQKQREITLKGFRNGLFEVLVATNVAARGLDIPEVDLVVQCSPPKVHDNSISQSKLYNLHIKTQ